MRRLGLHGLVHWRLLGHRRQPLALVARSPGGRGAGSGSGSGSGPAARPLAATLGADGALLLWAQRPLAPVAAVQPAPDPSRSGACTEGFTAFALLSGGEGAQQPAALAAATASGVHVLRVDDARCLMRGIRMEGNLAAAAPCQSVSTTYFLGVPSKGADPANKAMMILLRLILPCRCGLCAAQDRAAARTAAA